MANAQPVLCPHLDPRLVLLAYHRLAKQAEGLGDIQDHVSLGFDIRGGSAIKAPELLSHKHDVSVWRQSSFVCTKGYAPLELAFFSSSSSNSFAVEDANSPVLLVRPPHR